LIAVMLSRVVAAVRILRFTRALPKQIRPSPRTAIVHRRWFASRAPPTLFGSQGKSATELFAKTEEKKNSAQVAKELRAFVTAYDDDFDLRTTFINPLVKGEDLSAMKAELYPALNITTDETKELISELTERRALHKLHKIVTDFEKLVAYSLKEVVATVTTAEALSADDTARLESAIKTRLEGDEQLRLNAVVDPSVLGGLRVTLEGQSLDLTVASRIREIDRRIRNAE